MTIPGTIFYWLYGNPTRLYVKWNGKEIDAKLPAESMSYIGALGNGLYFHSNNKVYRAFFIPSDGIYVTYVRDVFEVRT
ncbi:hypothetical protein PMAYCL1PPCAC_09607, partial [Pristionchus mayeri]